jgi:DNA-binding NarL/FixJ family response regulator
VTTEHPGRPLRVVVVDDHPMFRSGLTALLEAIPDVEVVGQAGTGAQAEQVVASTLPDVVLMDLNLPDISGREVTARITAQYPQVAVLALTMLEDQATIVDTVRAGARGYLLKEATPDQIMHAVQAVANGQAVFGGPAATSALAAVGNSPRLPSKLQQLTEREREIADLLAQGLTNAAIAQRLHVSDKTVRNHVSNIFMKLGVRDRAAAVARARDAGLGQPPRV